MLFSEIWLPYLAAKYIEQHIWKALGLFHEWSYLRRSTQYKNTNNIMWSIDQSKNNSQCKAIYIHSFRVAFQRIFFVFMLI